MPGTFVALDLETTGLDPKTDEIIEIGLVRIEDGQVGETFHTLVRPSRPLPLRIKGLTGLNDGDLVDQPTWSEVRTAALAFLGDSAVVGHHVDFDLGFLERHAGYKARQAYDTADLARLLLPGLSSYRLQAVCTYLGVSSHAWHRALDDARAAAELFLALLNRFQYLDLSVRATVHRIFSHTPASPWLALVDRLVRSGVGDLATGQVESAACEAWPAAFPESGSAANEVEFGPEQVEAILGPGGRLAAQLPGFECREQQLEVARAITGALAGEKCLIVEAGTGTGKSFAYLVPSVLWALAGDQRVVVSTHTVNLQDQLIEKDLPLLRRALGVSLKAVLLKGRSHYLCRRRWEAVRNEEGYRIGEGLFYARIAVWLAATPTGDRAGLNLRPEEKRYWEGVAAGAWDCAGGRCRFFGSCFLQRARRAAEQAHLVITNHSLLLSDLRMENRLLPAYNALVIDEAHHLEDVATGQLGAAVTLAGFTRWAEAVKRLAGRFGEFFPGDRDELLRNGDQLLTAARGFFGLLGVRLQQAGNREEDYPSTRLHPRAANLDEDLELAASYGELATSLTTYRRRLARAGERLVDGSAPAIREELRATLDLEVAAGSRLAAELEFIFEAADADYVFWVEAGGRRPEDCVLQAAPVHVGRLLHDGLFRSAKPVILTSATLAVEESFSFFAERTGLALVSAGHRESLLVGSPFTYERQALLWVVTDLPAPVGPERAYLDGMVKALEQIIQITRGRTLVLFTAHKTLKLAYGKLKSKFEDQGIELLGHGIDGGRARLLQRFRSASQAVLFGASSFWEGVDVPGEALTCLVIVKLPFEPPDRPVLQARRERLRQEGQSDFNHLSLPQAVLRLKQGFGRLIRTTKDRGVVIILDNRLATKRYGTVFLQSLPLNSVSGPLEEALKALDGFAGVGTNETDEP